MSAERLTLHYHEGTYRNVPVRRVSCSANVRKNADFSALWGLMPDPFDLPRCGAESVTVEQCGLAVSLRTEVSSVPLLFVGLGPSIRNEIFGRPGILSTLAFWIDSAISTNPQEIPGNPNAGLWIQFETVPDLLVETKVFALRYILAAAGMRAGSGVFNFAVNAILRMVYSQHVNPRPTSVKENPIIATTAKGTSETNPYHGDHRLNRGLRGSTDRRRRIAVR